MERKRCIPALVAAIVISAAPTHASNMGFRLERNLDLVPGGLCYYLMSFYRRWWLMATVGAVAVLALVWDGLSVPLPTTDATIPSVYARLGEDRGNYAILTLPFGLRSSFGTLREWLYTAWCYGSDYTVCQEGLRRFGELGLRLDDYLGPPRFRTLASDAEARYYGADDAWRRDLAERYGVDYFVSSKIKLLKIRTALPVAFENARFVIHAAEPAHAPAP